MKLQLMSMVAAITLLLSCGTTTTTSSTSSNAAMNVPAGIRASFEGQYPTATNVVWTSYDATVVPIVDWELAGWPVIDAGDYVVRFNMDNQDYYAWYDGGGDWIGTAYVVNDYKTLPDAVTNTINTQFSGYAIEGVQREFWKDKTAYEIKLKKNNDDKVKLLVDANGSILKQKNKD